MKKYLILFLFASLNIFIHAQANRLESYQITTFNGVSRLSFTFTRRPDTNVIKEANSLKLTINATNTELGNVSANFSTPDIFARNVAITRHNKDLAIEITTGQAFEQIRQSATQSRNYIIHIDIIKTLSPFVLPDILGLLDYYHFVGQTDRINDILSRAMQDFPQSTELMSRSQNRFAVPRTYIPQALRPQPTQTTNAPTTQTAPRTTTTTPATTQATTPTTRPQTQAQTQPQTQTPPQAQTQAQTPAQTPPQQTISTQTEQRPRETRPATLPVASTTRSPELDNASLTLITIHDRFPTRIPQTKPIFIKEEEYPEEPDPPETPAEEQHEAPVQMVLSYLKKTLGKDEEHNEAPAQTVQEPTQTPVQTPTQAQIPTQTQPQTTPAQRPAEPAREAATSQMQERIVYRTMTDASGTSETARQLMHYYDIASVDSTSVAFLLGVSANIVGDFQNAIHHLSMVPDTDIHYHVTV